MFQQDLNGIPLQGIFQNPKIVRPYIPEGTFPEIGILFVSVGTFNDSRIPAELIPITYNIKEHQPKSG